ncbi:hypothetical protein ACFL3B_04820 [Gemmatimonadota bacterium]
MKPSRSVATLAIAAVALLWTVQAHSQGYRVRIDNRFQSVSYRAFDRDGGLGPELRGGPLTSTIDGSIWGFGVSGLSFHFKARGGVDVGDSDVWPGTQPTLQLLEGYTEYATRAVTAQIGRTHVISRLGWTGLDGGRTEVRPFGRRLQLFAYGGLGLARGIAIPVTSDALNPLDDYQPRRRQVLFGGGAGWSMDQFDLRVIYQRENGTGGEDLFSERAAVDGAIRPIRGITLSGGAEYNLATEQLGTADATLSYTAPRGRLRISVGGRHYRPHFDLWTIWGAFSPVPYKAGFGSVAATPIVGLELRTRAETYEFDDAGASNTASAVESGGWRWSTGATFTRIEKWTFSGGYNVDKGFGSRSIGLDGRVSFAPFKTLSFSAHASRLARPLEFRLSDAKVYTQGLRADYWIPAGVRLYAEVRRYDERRDLGVPTQLEWDQFRLNVGATIQLGSSLRTRGLHPAILRIPEGGESK